MRKLGHDEGYAKGYQAALDDMQNIMKIPSGKIISLSYKQWVVDKIQELKEKQNDR